MAVVQTVERGKSQKVRKAVKLLVHFTAVQEPVFVSGQHILTKKLFTTN